MDKQLDIITTSLEALLQRGTSPKNVGRDSAAIDAFCGLVKRETDCIPTAAKLIVSKMQSMQEWEALQALQLLEACMQHCGPLFHAEVGKFRFLNELIKLISPKYLGNLTPDSVRTEIVELLYLWTLEHPKETKIREAYEMLKKQRVVQSDPIVSNRRSAPAPAPSPLVQPASNTNKPLPLPRPSGGSCSILEDETQSKLLQKLLQSKKPEDLQAANKLIKSMVSEEERKMEQRCKVMLEMESINNNASLLTEMLDNYSGDPNDWDLMKELHTTCEGFRTNLVTLAQQLPSGDDDLFQLVISTNDSLSEVLAKFTSIMTNLASVQTNTPLLDMSSARPSPQHQVSSTASHLHDLVDLIAQDSTAAPLSTSLPSYTPTPPPSDLPQASRNVDLLNDDLLSNSSPDSQLLSFTSHAPSSPNPAMLTNQNPTSLSSTNHSTLTSSNQHVASLTSSNLNASASSPNQLSRLNQPSQPRSPNTFSSLSQDAFSAAANTPVNVASSINPSLSQDNSGVSSTTSVSSTPSTADFLAAGLTPATLLNTPVSNALHSNSAPHLDLISNSTLLGLNHPHEVSSTNIIDLTSPPNSSLNRAVSSQSSQPPSTQFSNHSASSVNYVQLKADSAAHTAQLPHKVNNVHSPTTTNKLKALKDLDELVGESLNRLGLHEDNNLVAKSGTNHMCEASTGGGDGGEVSRGGEDDEQLLLDDFTVDDINGCDGDVGKKEQEPEQTSIVNFTNNNTLPPSSTIIAPTTNSLPRTTIVPASHQTISAPCDNKLADICISLEDIVPSSVEPIRAMHEVNCVTILVHLTRSRPKPNVAVFVVTTLSKHKTPLSGYLFQPVVPKGYKLRLQPPSSTSLPAFNPFLPSPAITQIMLVACPGNLPNAQETPSGNSANLQETPTGNGFPGLSRGNTPNMDTLQNTNRETPPHLGHGEQSGSIRGETPSNGTPSNSGPLAISLKFVVSYEVDGEAMSEMGEVPDLPLADT